MEFKLLNMKADFIFCFCFSYTVYISYNLAKKVDLSSGILIV